MFRAANSLRLSYGRREIVVAGRPIGSRDGRDRGWLTGGRAGLLLCGWRATNASGRSIVAEAAEMSDLGLLLGQQKGIWGLSG